MNAILGQVGVALGLLSAITGAVALLGGLLFRNDAWLRAAPGTVWGVLAGALLATGAMEHALVTHDFSLAYVADNNSRETPLLYSVTGLWAALQGSILLWALVLSGYLAIMGHRYRARVTDRLVATALLSALVVTIFFFGLISGPANPFVTVAGRPPLDGLGPNALLQDNPLIAFHPVFLYLGFVGLTIPFSFAIGALVTGRLGEGWLVETRRFTLVSWAFLTVGIVMGAWWSYQVLGWGGFWAWDPVENAALLPWLCGTAYLHSVMIQERRGLLRVWNLALLVSAFSLTILGTFLTRSGVLVSVHAFSDSSAVGPSLLGFFGLVVASGVGLIAWRGDRLASPGSIDSPISREGAFLVNNLLFAAFAVVVLLGTVFPLLVQALDNQQVTVGTPYFDSIAVPLGLALLFFMAIAPALPWRASSLAVLRQRMLGPVSFGVLVIAACVAAGVRGLTPLAAFGLGAVAGGSALRQIVLATASSQRAGTGAWRGIVGRANGGMVVHIGVVLVAVSLASATSYGHRAEFTLRPGQSVSYEGHRIEYVGSHPFHQPNRSGIVSAVRVDGAVFHPAISDYPGYEGIGTPAVDSSIRDDVYLTVNGVASNGAGSATIGVVEQPMVMWLWVGGVLTALGALLAAFPARRRRRDSPWEGRVAQRGSLPGMDRAEMAELSGEAARVAAGVAE